MKRLHVSVGLPVVADTTYWRLCRKRQNHLSWTHSAAARAPHQLLHGATAADGCCAFVYIQHICRSGTPRLLVTMGTGYQTWLQSLGEIDLWPHSCSHTSPPPPHPQRLTRSDYPPDYVGISTGGGRTLSVRLTGVLMRREMRRHFRINNPTCIWSLRWASLMLSPSLTLKYF